jgi:hypothetical protein
MPVNPDYPNLAARLTGKLPQDAVDVIRIMNDNIQTVNAALDEAVASIPPPGLTLAQIKAGLQLGGEQPLDITALSGTPGNVVSSLNGAQGALVIAVTAGLTVAVSGQKIIISPAALQWQGFSLASGWSAIAGAFSPACAIDSNQTLRLCGGMAGTFTSGATVATLPASTFYPAHTLVGSMVVEDTTSSAYFPGLWEISGAGVISVVAPGVVTGHGAKLFFDGIAARLV